MTTMTSSTLTSIPPDEHPLPTRPPSVDIVVPVLDEGHVLAAQIGKLYGVLESQGSFDWWITIVDNGSTDDTDAVAAMLSAALPRVRVLHLSERGRGRALRAAWSRSEADVLAYTDVDLSTDLAALAPMVAALVAGHSSVATGSRLASGAHVVRGPKRELISRTYNAILRVVLGTRVRDAQCGFKAIRRDAAQALLPEIEDNGWFFDTELLVRAERHGMRVLEVPVDWVDDPDSRVAIMKTAFDDLRGIRRLVRQVGFRRRAVPPGHPPYRTGPRPVPMR
ncbi:MAG: glycosyltransferase [Actinomycetia bacterium]|nr:glycosyltransferase [Actinomycetes bacterium]